MVNLRRKGGLGKDEERAEQRAAQLADIDRDWNCPWPLNWQRHYRVLADLVDADGHLPHIAPGVLMDGDDIGTWRWRQQEPATWAQLLPEQQERLTELGIKAPAAPSPAPAATRSTKGAGKAQQAFQRGLAALAQWVEREGAHRPVPRGHGEEIVVDGETEPVIVKLGVWVSNTKSRRDKLTAGQLAALAALGVSSTPTKQKRILPDHPPQPRRSQTSDHPSRRPPTATHQPHPQLVNLAPQTPAPSPHQSLQTTGTQSLKLATSHDKDRCSTSRSRSLWGSPCIPPRHPRSACRGCRR